MKHKPSDVLEQLLKDVMDYVDNKCVFDNEVKEEDMKKMFQEALNLLEAP